MNINDALVFADKGPQIAGMPGDQALVALAAEVRRQHAEIERLRKILRKVKWLDDNPSAVDLPDELAQEIDAAMKEKT